MKNSFIHGGLIWVCMLFSVQIINAQCSFVSLSNPDETSLFSTCTTINIQDGLSISGGSEFNIPDGAILNAGTYINGGGSGLVLGDTYGAEFNISGNVNSASKLTLQGASSLLAGNQSAAPITFELANQLQLSGTSRLEIWGDLTTTGKIIVDANCTLIIHGNLSMESSAGNEFNGNIIVAGNATIKKCDIETNGNLVVGGELSISSNGSNLSGDIYAITDTDPDLPGGTNYGNLDDLAGSSDDSDLYEELLDLGIVKKENNWKGKNSNWNDPANWSNGIVPDLYTSPIISASANNPEVTENLVLVNLTVESGAVLTIKPGNSLFLKGNLLGIDNGLIIQNTNQEPSSFIVEGTATPKVKVEWTYSEAGQWWYIGHGLSGFTNSAYNSAFSGTNDYKLYVFSNQYSKINHSDTYTFSEPLLGYAFMMKETGSTLSYSGSVNNTSYDYSMETAQDYLVANPYTSYLDITSAGFDVGDAEPTIYTRTTLESGLRGFEEYNILSNLATKNASKYIAPGQSFWMVNTSTTVGNKLRISPSARSIGNGGALKNASSNNQSVLRVLLISNISNDECVIAFNNTYGSKDYTIADSKKKFVSNGFANIYTIKGEEKSVISVWPTIDGTEEIPLAYQVEQSGLSEFEMSFEGVNSLDPDYNVYLYDYVNNHAIDLRTVQSYVFTPEELTEENRFSIIFEQKNQNDITTSIEEEESKNELVHIFAAQGQIHIQVKDAVLNVQDALIHVYDMEGREVIQQAIQSSETIITSMGDGMYIVEVSGDDFIVKQKIIVTNK